METKQQQRTHDKEGVSSSSLSFCLQLAKAARLFQLKVDGGDNDPNFTRERGKKTERERKFALPTSTYCATTLLAHSPTLSIYCNTEPR